MRLGIKTSFIGFTTPSPTATVESKAPPNQHRVIIGRALNQSMIGFLDPAPIVAGGIVVWVCLPNKATERERKGQYIYFNGIELMKFTTQALN